MDESRDLGTRDIQSRDGGSGSSKGERLISTDTILSAVANEHRRAVLNALDNASEKTLEFDALVNHVADRIRNEGPGLQSGEHQQRVRIALHHTHLPKLEEAQIIDYDADRGHVRFVGGELEQDLLTLLEPYEAN